MLYCELRSPERTFYQGEVLSVTARSAKGEFAILAHHAALLAELSSGPIRIRTTSEEHVFACFGGTLSTDGSRVLVLGSEVVPRAEIDVESVRSALEDPSRSPFEASTLRARLAVLEKVSTLHD